MSQAVLGIVPPVPRLGKVVWGSAIMLKAFFLTPGQGMWLSTEHHSPCLPPQLLACPYAAWLQHGGLGEGGVSLPLAYDSGRLSPQGMPRLLRKSTPPNLNFRCGQVGGCMDSRQHDVFAAQLLPESPILLAHLYKQLWRTNYLTPLVQLDSGPHLHLKLCHPF